jgi:ATP-binding cassette subfamily B protein
MLGWVYRTIRQGLIDMAAMFRLIDTAVEVEDLPGAPALVVRRPTVAFDEVVFGYEPDREILHGLSFEVPAGAHVAIVGPSGAGKSTIGRLLFRFYDPWSGRILIDGQDIRDVTQESLRAQSASSRRTRCCSTTRSATTSPTDATARGSTRSPPRHATRRSCRSSSCCRRLRHRSRRARAQALGRREAARGDRPHAAQEPADPAARRGHQRARHAHRAGHPATLRACPSTAPASPSPTACRPIADADTIFVLDQGRLAESGTHAALLRRDGLYADMWNRQLAEREEAMDEAAE